MADSMTAHHEQKTAAGEWKWTNELAKETSPYLLQHAHNPVDWYPWGEKAFELARKENKPIFLSVGYSTCYWCHVMERQSFENPEIAKLMNEMFICIKVDREERPDVDDIYMSAVQKIAGQGGWPMSVWLTPPGANGEDDPGLKPFYAGTYFPPQDAYGRPGFPTVLRALGEAWQEKRDQILEQSEQVAQTVRESLAADVVPGDISMQSVSLAAHQLLRMYDKDDAGFGNAPKFPQPAYLVFLMQVYQNNPDEELWKPLAHTLDRMARGGMYDQVGGGFHRYSTDGQWLVPHFEKMLYDNGQLAYAYAAAHQMNPPVADGDFYARIAREICNYVLREMLDETGTFWSAQDAEVDAREGLNYLWLPDEVKKAIGDEALAVRALQMYGLDKGTNFQDPHHADEPKRNVLYLPKPLHELADEWGMKLDDVVKLKKQIDAKLLAVRDKRKQPGTDDKVLVAWNGMMIAGMARTGSTLDEQKYIDAAKRAATYILENMRDAEGGLMRSMRDGVVKIPAFLEDYAYLVWGLLEIHYADPTGDWLEHAVKLTDTARTRFAFEDVGGYYDTLADQADLFVRTRSVYDGAVPSGNSRMVNNLLDLAAATDEQYYVQQAATDLHSFAEDLKRYGAGVAQMQQAVLRLLESNPDLATVPKADKPVAEEEEERNPLYLKVNVDPQTADISKPEIDIVLTLTIDEGHHINDATVTESALIPTELTLIGTRDWEMQVDFPKGTKQTFPYSDEPVSVYEGEVKIPIKLTRKIDNPEGIPMLILQYQACTDKACMQPIQMELPIRFK